jgi:transmembrane sensor
MKEQEFQIEVIRYLAGELSAGESERLLEYLRTSAERQKFFEEYKKIWVQAGMEGEIPPISIEDQWQRFARTAFEQSEKPAIIPLWFRPFFRIAAGVAILATSLIAWSLLTTGHKTGREVLLASAMEVLEHTLPDGSTVWLDKESTIEYQVSFEPRTIRLQGQALFEVKHLDTEHPFTVESGATKTTVLGTVFLVKSVTGSQPVTVYVEEGKVSFENTSGTAMLILSAGEQAQYDLERQMIEKSSEVDQNLLSWKTGEFSFEDTPLAEILPQLELYYGVRFKIINPGLLRCTYHSDFANMALDEMLDELSFGLNLRIQKNDSGIYEVDGTPCQ